jgi:hypothetical protein
MSEHNPSLDPGDVEGILLALAERPRWRDLEPEDAADGTFDTPRATH